MAKLKVITEDKRINYKKIAKAVYKTLSQKDKLSCEIVFVSAEEIRALNASTRGVDSATDVLSFPTLDGIKNQVLVAKDFPSDCDGDRLFIGSIVLNEEKIEEQAKSLGHTFQIETQYLTVHGLCHLFGFDHMTDEDKVEMRKVEKQALMKLGVNE